MAVFVTFVTLFPDDIVVGDPAPPYMDSGSGVRVARAEPFGMTQVYAWEGPSHLVQGWVGVKDRKSMEYEVNQPEDSSLHRCRNPFEDTC